MDHDIEEMVRLCVSCAAAAKQPLKASLQSWPPTSKLRERIHIDLAGPHLGRHSLIVVDAYSNYHDVFSVSSTTSRQTLAITHKLCTQHGVPETIVSGYGTQFTSHEFREYCKGNAISHILSPPYHPQSNGRDERFVDTFKRDFLKLRGEGNVDKFLDIFLLAYRTKHRSTISQQRCPAELLFGRKPRTTMGLLSTKQPIGRDIKKERQFNCLHGTVARNFDGGDPVYVRYRQSHDWKAESVAKRISGSLSDVTLADGSTRRLPANPIRLRFTQLTDNNFTAFADAFNLPVRSRQVANGETEHLDEHAVDHKQQTSNQGTPAVDDVKPVQLSKALSVTRRSK